jgi:predicted Zn-ribbon and HTH transcriptional regulator
MSLLNNVLHTIQSADGPLTVDDIAHAVEADPGAVAGMLDLLARKGRLRVDGALTCEASACGGCGFGGAGRCPFVVKTPTRFEIVQK